MIVVKVAGGLGNQMFQYALGLQLSIKNGTSLWLDLSWFDQYKDLDYPRTFKLDQLQTRFNKVNLQKLTWRFRYTSHFPFLNPMKLKTIKEVDFAVFDAGLMEAGNNVLLEGFFSSYKYFESIREKLLTEFRPVSKMDATNTACLQRIKSTNSVSVHVRRGDYALTDFHGMLDKVYYEAAIDLIAQKTGDLQLFIFSDEPDWVLQNMNFSHPYEMIHFNKDDHNYFDMDLMKHCKHNIIANSTFSWWPAWLNENPEKIVVAPKRWNKQGTPTSALLPADWVLL